jgi:hypothetical protein
MHFNLFDFMVEFEVVGFQIYGFKKKEKKSGR